MTETEEILRNEADYWKKRFHDTVIKNGENAFERWKLEQENKRLRAVVEGIAEHGAAR